MKNIQLSLGLFSAFLVLNCTVFSQCCPYIDSVQVAPENPLTTDEIQVFTLVAPPNLGSLISHDFFLQNDTLYINACYYSGFLTVVLEIPDTLTIGSLPEGDYVLSFTATMSYNESTCVAESSQNDISYFTVGSTAALLESELSMNLLYPNPVQSSLTLTGITDDTQVVVYDLKGSLIEVPVLFSAGSVILELNGLVAGWYNLVTTTANRAPIRYSFCKE